MRDFNFHRETSSELYVSQLVGLLDEYNFKQHVTNSTYIDGHVLDIVLFRTYGVSVMSTVVYSLVVYHHWIHSLVALDQAPGDPKNLTT